VFPPLKWGRRRQWQEMQDTHSALETNQMLQDNCMFVQVHSAQEEGWWPVGKTIVTHTNFFSAQQEHNGIISPNNQIVAIMCAHLTDTDEGGIRN